jgi:hypothetical protein
MARRTVLRPAFARSSASASVSPTAAGITESVTGAAWIDSGIAARTRASSDVWPTVSSMVCWSAGVVPM